MSPIDNNDNSELIVFEQEPTPEVNISMYPKWKILIVDDDEQTHLVTKLALSDVRILKRDLNLLHAYSSEEAYDEGYELGIEESSETAYTHLRWTYN